MKALPFAALRLVHHRPSGLSTIAHRRGSAAAQRVAPARGSESCFDVSAVTLACRRLRRLAAHWSAGAMGLTLLRSLLAGVDALPDDLFAHERLTKERPLRVS